MRRAFFRGKNKEIDRQTEFHRIPRFANAGGLKYPAMVARNFNK